MTASETIDEKKIRLNHPCEICKNTIYIGTGTIIETRPLHFKCFKEEVIEETRKETIAECEEDAKIERNLACEHAQEEIAQTIFGKLDNIIIEITAKEDKYCKLLQHFPEYDKVKKEYLDSDAPTTASRMSTKTAIVTGGERPAHTRESISEIICDKTISKSLPGTRKGFMCLCREKGHTCLADCLRIKGCGKEFILGNCGAYCDFCDETHYCESCRGNA